MSRIIPAPSKSTWSRHFQHLKPLSKAVMAQQRRMAAMDREPPLAKPRDRIKQWNIVPGDQVRALNSSDPKAIREVLSVDKYRNWVYLRASETSTSTSEKAEHIHYSKLQLYLGEREFPPTVDSSEPRKLPVFAKRVVATRPQYIAKLRRWVWTRFASATIPKLPSLESSSTRERVLIPWPKPSAPPIPSASFYDTPASEANKITWSAAAPVAPEPTTNLQDEYLTSIHSRDSSYDPSMPMEHYLADELSNPHSRAKKQARWQEALRAREALKAEFINAELKNLQGRTRTEARKEAEFKWKERLVQDAKAEKHRRWVNRGMEDMVKRTAERKAKREARRLEKLRSIELVPETNQVVPALST